MRYGPGIGNKVGIIKRAMDGSYRATMLILMYVEIILLALLVWKEYHP